MFKQSDSLDFTTKQLNRMKHIESFVKKDKTLVEYSPGLFRPKEFITFVFKKDKKKGKMYYPVFRSKSLDSALFVYNNLHIIYVMNMSRQKPLLNIENNKGENVKKVLLLDADFDEQGNHKMSIVKSNKDLKIHIIPVYDPDELCLE